MKEKYILEIERIKIEEKKLEKYTEKGEKLLN